MAKHDKEIEQEQLPSSVSDTTRVTDAMPSTLYQVAVALAGVAEGKSVTALRILIAELMPKDKTKAREFSVQLNRLRQAAEVANTVGQEMLSGIEN